MLAVSWALTLALGVGAAHAQEACEIEGKSVNPNNGYTTQGKTGLMRCREREGGLLRREQELQNGVFMGAVRYFDKTGAVQREYRVNEKGNREGLSREYEPSPEGGKPVLVREETLQDSRTVGLARTWHLNGKLKRVAFHEGDAEIASASFNAQGQPTELRCAPRPVLGRDADDLHWCGHAGGVSGTALYDAKGNVQSRVTYERGERRSRELLWSSGSVREQQEQTPAGGFERRYAADGTPQRETAWVMRQDGGRAYRLQVLEKEFHETGKLVREKRWKPNDKGNADFVSEQQWYLNGQPKQLSESAVVEGQPMRRETSFHDNGTKAAEGLYVLPAAGTRGAERATGVHRSWDAAGRLRAESTYDARGRIAREREFDTSGATTRDDEVFEDGSRKAYGK